VPHVHIAGGTHDVVYVATANDSVYSVDANNDTKILKVSLGTPVPWPIGCGNNGPTVGIDGTPAIDLASHTMYVIAYILDPANGNAPEYYVHALDLSTLIDKVPPRLLDCDASAKLPRPPAWALLHHRETCRAYRRTARGRDDDLSRRSSRRHR
jgi:hypothetical protein